MAVNNPYQAYKQTQVETASPEELLLMLYRGALNFLQKGKKALEEGDLEKSHYYLVRTQDILAELMGSLNAEGEESMGELIGGLFSVYEYMHHRLVQANLKKEKAPVEEVERMFRYLLEAWNQALTPGNAPEGEQASAPSRDSGGVSYRG